jgi:hypothetical protein
MIGVIAFLAGIAAGLAFNIWALLPLIILDAIAVLSIDLVSGMALSSATLSCGLSILLLQGGYGVGVVARVAEGRRTRIRATADERTDELTRPAELSR